MSLLSICSDVLNPVLADWVEIEDFTFLDSAFCNHSLRMSFLHLISRENFAHKNKPRDRGMASKPYFLDWLIVRKIRVKNLSLLKVLFYKPSLMKYLGTISSLDSLTVEYSDSLLRYLERCDCKIESLTFKNQYQQTDSEFKGVIQKLRHPLKKLKFTERSSKLTDETIAVITRAFPKLEQALICNDGLNNPLTVNIINLLADGCSKLVKVMFLQVSDTTVCNLAEKCPLIESFRIGSAGELTDETVIKLANHWPNLNEFSLHGSLDITDKSVIVLAAKCTKLRILNLGSACVTDVSLLQIGKSCKLLEDFRVSPLGHYAYEITDAGVCAVIKNNSNLTSLWLWSCPSVTDSTILCLAKYSHKLVSLLSHSTIEVPGFLTDYSLVKLWNCCNELQVIEVSDSQMSTSTLLVAAEGCKYLELKGNTGWLNRPKIRKVPSSRKTPEGTFLKASTENMTFHYSCFKTIAEVCPLLLSLSLDGYKELTNNMLIAMFKLCPHICVLKLLANVLVTGDVLIDAVKYCKDLHSVSVSRMSTLTDDILVSVLKNGQKWQCLSFVACENLTDVSVTCVGDLCLELTHFSIVSNKTLTNTPIFNIIDKCRMLRVLEISECVSLTPDILTAIHQSDAISLRKLFVDRCPYIGKDHVISFLSVWSGVTVVHEYNPYGDDY